jgi:hypothetical protein
MEGDAKLPMFSEAERLRLQQVYLDFWILLKECEREIQSRPANQEQETKKNL